MPSTTPPIRSTPHPAARPARGVLHLAVAALVAVLGTPASSAAQTLQGTIMNGANLQPVGSVFVRLLDREGSLRALTMADEQGRYSVRAPRPGTYVVIPSRIGFEDYQRQEVSMPDEDGVYDLTLMVAPSAVAIEGLEVTVERRREVNRNLRLMLGTSPSTLRSMPIYRDRIMDAAERSDRISDLIAVSNISGLVTRVNENFEPCFIVRNGGCAPVFLDGARIPSHLINQIPLDLLEAIVFVQPGESREHEFAVLLYTVGWLGSNP